MTFDATGNLWVVNQASNSLEEFAPGATGNVAPEAIIAGTVTGLSHPSGMTPDSHGNLLVANTYASSLTECSTTNPGNVAPLSTISGSSTGLSYPDGVDVDSFGNIWVSNQFAGLTGYSAGSSGNVTPFTTVYGPSTGLSAPTGLAVAPPLSVATTHLPVGYRWHRYKTVLQANLGTTPYHWSLSRGELAPGLRLKRDGELVGRPRRRGVYRFTVSVRDSSHPEMTASRALRLVIR